MPPAGCKSTGWGQGRALTPTTCFVTWLQPCLPAVPGDLGVWQWARVAEWSGP